MWAKSAVSELDRVLSQMHTYGTSLVQALQPKHTEDEGVRDGFAQCVRNFADVTELRSALSRMKASSTGGLCGVTREHFSNAPDHVLEWVLELTQDVVVVQGQHRAVSPDDVTKTPHVSTVVLV